MPIISLSFYCYNVNLALALIVTKQNIMWLGNPSEGFQPNAGTLSFQTTT